MNKAMNEMITEIKKTSGDTWIKGWAERNAGNISVRLSAEELDDKSGWNMNTGWSRLDKPVHDMGGEYLLVTGTGKYLRNIEIAPEENLGIVEIDDRGENYRVVWGYTKGGQPTSELPSHLQAHSVRKRITAGENRVILHTHPANIIALSYSQELDTVKLTRLLWEMHAECIVVFPDGIEFLPWMLQGTNEIADATAKAFEKRRAVVWQYHGVFASGRSLDEAFGLIDTVEKASGIFIKAVSSGGVRNRLSLSQMLSIASRFGEVPDSEIVERIRK